MKSLIDNPKPGDFRAVCNLRTRVAEATMTPDLWEEARAVGYVREFLELQSGRVDPEKKRRGRWEIRFTRCGGLDSTDRDEFVRHMTEKHGRTVGAHMNAHRGGAALSPTAWKAPRLTEDGKPWDDTKGRTRTCEGCGLVDEVADTRAADLWWTEHLEGCAIALRVAS